MPEKIVRSVQKVRHEYEHRGRRYRIVEETMSTTNYPFQLQREVDGDWFFDHEPDIRLSDEILRLAAELAEAREDLARVSSHAASLRSDLARSRSEGRLEGIRSLAAKWDSLDLSSLEYVDSLGYVELWNEIGAEIDGELHAAERELAGGKEDEG